MAKTKLTVTLADGTQITRTTARTYTHVVVVKGYRAERLEASRVAAIARYQQDLAKYRRTVETGQCQDARGDWDRTVTAQLLAEGRFQVYIADCEAEIAHLTAIGPITEDHDSYDLSAAAGRLRPATWGALGWCGRLDLARTLASTDQASRYRHVAIIDVATGQVVR